MNTQAPLNWWRARWRIFRSPDASPGNSFWAIGEIFCAVATIVTLTAACSVVIAAYFVEVPSWLAGAPMRIALAGSVGYGTNFLAVQMLFKPRKPFRSIPLRWIWRQGLIPAKQAEMARVVGEEVEARLLPPESIVAETVRLLETTLADRELVARLQRALYPRVREQLLPFLRHFLPDVLELLRAALMESLPPEVLREHLASTIQAWFDRRSNREMMAAFLLSVITERTDEIIKILKKAVKRYSKSSRLRAFTLRAGTATDILNWDELESVLKEQLGRPKSQSWALRIVDRFAVRASSLASESLDLGWLNELKEDAGDIALRSVSEVAELVTPRLLELLESERAVNYVHEELLPGLEPKLMDWIRAGNLDAVIRRFDVRGRVASAAAELDVEELERMANRVGAEHLGAIQVIGYVLGLGAGVLLALLGSSA